jgi:uncharacterized protein (DUF2461 family)
LRLFNVRSKKLLKAGFAKQFLHGGDTEDFALIGVEACALHGRGPYKDHLWFCVRTGDEDWTGKPTFYFEIAPDYYSYGLGFWAAAPATMERFRRHAAEHPEELEALTEKLLADGRFTLAGPRYAREKKAPSALLQPWFQMKSVTLQFETPLDERIFHRSLADEIVAELGELVPFYRYFAKIAAQAD